MESAGKKIYVQNFGCQMNDYDAERMVEVMRRQGYAATHNAEEADLIIINSCSVRDKAEQKTASAAGRYRELKQAKPGLVVAVGGCVAQQEGDRLLERVPVADFTFGPDLIPALPSLMKGVSRKRFAATQVIEVEEYQFLDADPEPGSVKVTALVTIQKGCDNHCAFCVVPTTRGREVSRPAEEVVAEVARFVALGAREVTLIGQNVNSYHGIGTEDGDDFAELLARVDKVPDLLRQRFTTSHPKDFTPKVARAFAELPTLGSWLHLPVQSGSSRTLKRMVRDYTRQQYLEKIGYLKQLVPDISLSTDIIVGYPGESESEHQETLSLLQEVQYDSIYSFEYSPRPDTPALKLRDSVPKEIKKRRLQEVQTLQRQITARRLQRWVGRDVEVLVEGESKRGQGQLCGRTRGNELVHFFGAEGTPVAGRIGTLVTVHISGAGTNTLQGRMEQSLRRRLPLYREADGALR